MTPAITLLRWPRMSLATAGVPQAAASVRVSPHPSASEALDTTHDALVQLHQVDLVEIAEECDPVVGAGIFDLAVQLVLQGARADDLQLQPGHPVSGLDHGVDEGTESLHRRQPADPDDQGEGAFRPPGWKRGSTPFGIALTRSGLKPISSSSSRVASEGVSTSDRL